MCGQQACNFDHYGNMETSVPCVAVSGQAAGSTEAVAFSADTDGNKAEFGEMSARALARAGEQLCTAASCVSACSQCVIVLCAQVLNRTGNT